MDVVITAEPEIPKLFEKKRKINIQTVSPKKSQKKR